MVKLSSVALGAGLGVTSLLTPRACAGRVGGAVAEGGDRFGSS